MNKRQSVAIIIIVTLIVIMLLILVSGTRGADSSGTDNRVIIISDSNGSYSASAADTVNGTHILTDGCRDAKKTKRHLLEEAISALFDGDFSEVGKKLTFLNIFSLNACDGYSETPVETQTQPPMADDIEIERDSDILLETVFLPPIDQSRDTNNNSAFDNRIEGHLHDFPVAATTWNETYRLNSTVPYRGYQVFYMHADNPSKVIEKGQVGVVAKKYSWSDFKDIPSEKFMAYWTGSLNVPESGFYQVLISKSHSKARVLIDKYIVIDDNKGSDETQKVYIPAGNHVVEVEYSNGWHTTDVALAISPMSTVKQPQNPNQFLSAIKQRYPDVVALYAGAYEADNHAIALDIPTISKPVVLYLSSYEAIKWQINNPGNANIVGVVYGSYEQGSQVQGLTQKSTIINSNTERLGYENNMVCHCNGGSSQYSSQSGQQCNVKGARNSSSVNTGNPYEKYGIDIIQFVGSYSTDYFTFQPYSGECATVGAITKGAITTKKY